MKQTLILLILSVLSAGCAPTPEEFESELVEMGRAEQDISACRFYGWRWDVPASWDHYRCNPNDSTHACLFPPPYVPSPNAWLIDGSLSGVPTANQRLAFTNAMIEWDNYELVRWTQAGCTADGAGGSWICNLRINNVSLGGSYQVYDMPIHDVMQLACVSYTPITESYPAVMGYCNAHVASVDWTKFENWMTWRGFSSTVKQNKRSQLARHILGGASGLGGTDAGGTPMCLTLTGNTTAWSQLQLFEQTILVSYDPANPNTASFFNCN